MPDTIIFGVGSIVFLMLSLGLIFTVVEVRRLDREATERDAESARSRIAR